MTTCAAVPALSSFAFTREEPLPLWVLTDSFEEDGERYSSCVLVEVNHYKEKDLLVGHEFVVLHLRDGNTHVYLRLERRPAARKPRRTLVLNLSGSPLIRITDDTITKSSTNVDVTTLYHLTKIHCSTDSPITLSSIIPICCKIQETAPNYKLLSKQCYWFCDTFITELLRTHNTLREEPMANYEHAGCVGPFRILPKSQRAKMTPPELSADLSEKRSWPWLRKIFPLLPAATASRRLHEAEPFETGAENNRKSGFGESTEAVGHRKETRSPSPPFASSFAPIRRLRKRISASTVSSDGSSTLAPVEQAGWAGAEWEALTKLSEVEEISCKGMDLNTDEMDDDRMSAHSQESATCTSYSCSSLEYFTPFSTPPSTAPSPNPLHSDMDAGSDDGYMGY